MTQKKEEMSQKSRQQATYDLVDELVFVLKKRSRQKISLGTYQEKYGLTSLEMRSLVSGISHDSRIGVTYEEECGCGVTKVVFLKTAR